MRFAIATPFLVNHSAIRIGSSVIAQMSFLFIIHHQVASYVHLVFP